MLGQARRNGWVWSSCEIVTFVDTLFKQKGSSELWHDDLESASSKLSIELADIAKTLFHNSRFVGLLLSGSWVDSRHTGAIKLFEIDGQRKALFTQEQRQQSSSGIRIPELNPIIHDKPVYYLVRRYANQYSSCFQWFTEQHEFRIDLNFNAQPRSACYRAVEETIKHLT